MDHKEGEKYQRPIEPIPLQDGLRNFNGSFSDDTTNGESLAQLVPSPRPRNQSLHTFDPRSRPFYPANGSSSPARPSQEHTLDTSFSNGQAAPEAGPPTEARRPERTGQPIENGALLGEPLSVDRALLRWAATSTVELYPFEGKVYTASPPDGLLPVLTQGVYWTARHGTKDDIRTWQEIFATASGRGANIHRRFPRILEQGTNMIVFDFLRQKGEEVTFFVDFVEVSEDHQVALEVAVYKFEAREYESNVGAAGFSRDLTVLRPGPQRTPGAIEYMLAGRRSSLNTSGVNRERRPGDMSTWSDEGTKAAFFSKANEIIGRSVADDVHVDLVIRNCGPSEVVTDGIASSADGRGRLGEQKHYMGQ